MGWNHEPVLLILAFDVDFRLELLRNSLTWWLLGENIVFHPEGTYNTDCVIEAHFCSHAMPFLKRPENMSKAWIFFPFMRMQNFPQISLVILWNYSDLKKPRQFNISPRVFHWHPDWKVLVHTMHDVFPSPLLNIAVAGDRTTR